MAGTAPTEFQFTKMLDAGPVHCSGWLCFTAERPEFFPRLLPLFPCQFGVEILVATIRRGLRDQISRKHDHVTCVSDRQHLLASQGLTVRLLRLVEDRDKSRDKRRDECFFVRHNG